MKICKYYNNCYSECNANSILSELNGDNVSCYIQKGILKEIKNYILESKENMNNLNSNYIKLLINK